MRYVVTGTAGFIGFHLARRLLHDGHDVTGIDGLTPYYDVSLKRKRHEILLGHERFSAHILKLEEGKKLAAVIERAQPAAIIHLAAQAGVRYSIENPQAYAEANLNGTFNLLECAKDVGAGHLLLASTSSIYGANRTLPFRETDRADHPLTFYAATKKSCELMAHSYSHLWRIPTTVVRFFTVYGPWGRPDMALFKFVDAILGGREIDVYGHGKMSRDFTYIDDLVEAMVRLLALKPEQGADCGTGEESRVAPYRIVNIGSGRPVDLLAFIDEIERVLGRTAKRNHLPMQPGELEQTFAKSDYLAALTGYRPNTPLAVGVRAFVDWYRTYYGV